MKIKGMDALLKMRREGNKPALPVWMWIGFEPAKYNGTGIELEVPRPSRSIDLRPLIGLDVMMCARTYSPELFDLFEAVKTNARSVILWVEAWDDSLDSMLLWDRNTGQRTLEECGA